MANAINTVIHVHIDRSHKWEYAVLESKQEQIDAMAKFAEKMKTGSWHKSFACLSSTRQDLISLQHSYLLLLATVDSWAYINNFMLHANINSIFWK